MDKPGFIALSSWSSFDSQAPNPLEGKLYPICRLIVSELEAVMVEGVAHPGVPQSIGGQPDVILAPDSLIFEGIRISQVPGQVPGERVDPTAFLDVFDDDRQVGARPQKRL
jgi:hypothetical protein